MKILMTEKYMRNLIKISQNTPSVMYHVTEEKNIPRILREGLKVGQERSFTQIDWMEDYYGDEKPLFLSIEPWEEGEGLKAIQINISGLQLFPDIPSLTDHGGYFDEEQDGSKVLWWKDKDVYRAGPLADYFEEGSIYVDDLLSGGSEAGRVAIGLTGTAVVFEDIPPNRIIGVLDTFKKERMSDHTYDKEISEQFLDTPMGLEDDNPVSGIDY